MAKLFIKYDEISDNDIRLMLAGTSIILSQFYTYFENLGIPLDQVNSWGRPDGFDSVWDIHKKCLKVFENRNLELPDEIVRIKSESSKIS